MDQSEIIRNQFFNALWNQRNFDVAREIFSEDFFTEPLSYNPPKWEELHGLGPDSMIHHIKDWLSKIPDAKMVIEDLCQNGDSAMALWHLEGKLEKELMGIAGDGQSIRIQGMTLFCFEGGKIKKNRTLVDVYGLMLQLGAL